MIYGVLATIGVVFIIFSQVLLFISGGNSANMKWDDATSCEICYLITLVLGVLMLVCSILEYYGIW